MALFSVKLKSRTISQGLKSRATTWSVPTELQSGYKLPSSRTEVLGYNMGRSYGTAKLGYSEEP
jgi:hypothetical protein